MALSTTGTLEIAQAVTNYQFPDAPYIQARYGWAADSQANAKAFAFTLVPGSGYQVTVTSISFVVFANNAGPSAVGYDLGGWASGATNAPDQRLLEVRRVVTGVSGITNPLTVLIQGWTNGSRATAGTGYLRLDDLVLQGSVTAIALPVDQDADGLPDALEVEWCGGDCDPGATPPGGFHTYRELYILDATPAQNPSFDLALQVVPGSVQLQFVATNSRVYSVEYRDQRGLGGEVWTAVEAPRAGSNGVHTVADPGGVGVRCYRARVQLE